MLGRLAHVIVRRRRLVIGIWVALTLFGAFSASQVSKRWFQSFSIPGYSAYEANKRTLETFGTGMQAPLVAVFHTKGDVTKDAGIQQAVDKAAAVNPGSRTSSYWSTGSKAYVSADGHTAFAEIYPPGSPKFSSDTHIKQVRAALTSAPSPPISASTRRLGPPVLPFAFASMIASWPVTWTEIPVGNPLFAAVRIVCAPLLVSAAAAPAG